MSNQSKIDLLNFKLFLANSQKNHELVAELLEKLEECFIDLKKETRISQNETSKLVASYLIEEAKAKIEMDKKEKAFYASRSNIEKREKKLIYIFLTGLFIFIGVSTFVFFQQLKNNKKKLELEKEAQRIESEKERLKLSNWAKE
jgi:ABC-type bacteriocin/lantibiotic exporter with double-glycine peptidase domain